MQGVSYGYQQYGGTPFGSAAAQTYWPDVRAPACSYIPNPSYTLHSTCSAEVAATLPRFVDHIYGAPAEVLNSNTEQSESEPEAPISGSFDSCSFNVSVKVEDPADGLAAAGMKREAAAAAKDDQQSRSRSGSASTSPRGEVAQSFATPGSAAYNALHPSDIAIIFRSQYRGVSYDKKKRKWRVQIKVASLGKSGVSVGYFDTEEAAARAYDKAAIGLLGREQCRSILNFPIEEYDINKVPQLVGKTREEVKATLKNERAKIPRRRLTHRRRTSRYLGVGSSNRKNQWQARILYHGKVTHLGYYRTEEEAARVYDRVSISLHGEHAQTNFPLEQYAGDVAKLRGQLAGLSREELQRSLGVKPMDKSSRFRGVSKKKGKWEAKVMLNRKWAYRELFETEAEAAHAYDAAVWRLKPREARSYVNFKNSCPPDVAEALGGGSDVGVTPQGIPLTAQPLLDAGLLYQEDCAASEPVDSPPASDPRSPPAYKSAAAAAAVGAGREEAAKVHRTALQHCTSLPSSSGPNAATHAAQAHAANFSRQLSLPALPRHPAPMPSPAGPSSYHPPAPIASAGPYAAHPLGRMNSAPSSASSFVPPSPLGSPPSPYAPHPLHTAQALSYRILRVGSESHLLSPREPHHHAHPHDLPNPHPHALHAHPHAAGTNVHHAAPECHLPHHSAALPVRYPNHPYAAPHHYHATHSPRSNPSLAIDELRTHPHSHPYSWASSSSSHLPSSYPQPTLLAPGPLSTKYPTLPDHPTWSHPSSAPAPFSHLHSASTAAAHPPASPRERPAGWHHPDPPSGDEAPEMMDVLPVSFLDILPDPLLDPLNPLHNDLFPGDDLDLDDHDLPSPPSSPAAAGPPTFFQLP